MVKKSTKQQINFWITFGVGVTFAYGMWLVWKKLTDTIGDSNIVLLIIAGILIIAGLTGYFSFKQVAKRFT